MCLRRHREAMNMNLSENPHCLILSSLGHVLFSSQRRNKADCHQQELQPRAAQPRVGLKPVGSCFSHSLPLHKGDDVILSAVATWPACRHCLHRDTSALPALCQLGGTVRLELLSLAAPRPTCGYTHVRFHAPQVTFYAKK